MQKCANLQDNFSANDLKRIVNAMVNIHYIESNVKTVTHEDDNSFWRDFNIYLTYNFTIFKI